MKIFHHNDADGRCSAALIYMYAYQGEDEDPIECIEMDYTTEFPIGKIEKDEKVYIVDYSIDPSMMEQLIAITHNIIWIDHHKSAIEKYEKYPNMMPAIGGLRIKEGVSASKLVWRYLGGNDDDIPVMVRIIDDWDIWKHEYPHTKPFITAFNARSVYTDPKNTLFWTHMNDGNYIDRMITDGMTMIKFRDGWAEEVLNHVGFKCTIGGLRVFAVNIPHANSEYFKSLDKAEYDAFMPFYYDPNKMLWTYSMYSVSEGTDVGVICAKYGGGGHKNAAGFTSPYDIATIAMIESGVLDEWNNAPRLVDALR